MKRLWQDFLVFIGLRKRIELEFTDEKSWRFFNQLCAEAGKSHVGYIRRAVALYAIARDARKSSFRFASIDQNGEPVKEILV